MLSDLCHCFSWHVGNRKLQKCCCHLCSVCLSVWIQAVSRSNRWRWSVKSSSVASVSTAFHLWLKPDSHKRLCTWRPAWITAHISNKTVASYCIDLGSVPGQSMWDFRWTECHLGSKFFSMLYLPLSELFHCSCVENCKRKWSTFYAQYIFSLCLNSFQDFL